MSTQSEFVGGAIDQAVNEAVGDILPGAHVAFSQYNATEDVWIFTVTMPPVGDIKVPAGTELAQIIDEAEALAREARQRLVLAFGKAMLAEVEATDGN